MSLSSQPLSKCDFGLHINEKFLWNLSITQVSFHGNRLGWNSIRVFFNQLYLFAAKSRDPKERRQIQKLQTFYHFYGSTLEDSTSKLIVCQDDVSGNANAAVKKTQRKHVSIFKLLLPNLFYYPGKDFYYMSPTAEVLYSECTSSSQLKKFKLTSNLIS